MNQPTREEFEKFKQEVREEIRQEFRQLFEHRQTEEMPAINVNVGSEDVLRKLDAIGQKLDRIDQKQDEHAKALLAHSKAISVLQTSVEALPTEERVEALLIKYLRPSGNGHSKES